MASSAYEKLDRPVDDSDSENEHEARTPRSSEDARRHDLETLNAEGEAERLLGRSDAGISSEKREPRRQRRRKSGRRDGEKVEESELMYAMEEGGRLSSSESGSGRSSGNSSEVDLQRLREVQLGRKKSKTSRFAVFARFTLIHLLIIAAFLALLYGAYVVSQSSTTKTNKTIYTPQRLSNGTHLFAPTTLLLSLDGFRADFLHRNITPTLSSFVRSGVSPKFMLPSFPSLTFPNHFTLVTGLYPESHGVVGNTFWDPNLEEEFDYGHAEKSMQPKWWQAKPLWVTAEKQGVRSAIHMWPGSEAGIGGEDGKPFAVDEFDADEALQVKVDRVLGWLDAEEEERPQFIAAYVPDVDADGHLFGPNSTEIYTTIGQVDGMLGRMFEGIEERNLTSIVNIIVVSDHGMATTSNKRLLQYEDLIDPLAPEEIAHTDGWPLYGLRLKDSSEAKLVETYNQLFAKSRLPKYHGAFDVYLRDRNMPARYHFSHNERIAPLWIVPKPGWAIVKEHEFKIDVAKEQGAVYHPKGLHGYDHEHPLMRAIFVARGPAFPHEGGSVVEPFQNTEVYNIVCDTLGIEPGASNGTLRLPLETEGRHDFDSLAAESALKDLPGNGEEEDDGNEDEIDNTVPVLPPVFPNLASPGSPHTPTITDHPSETSSSSESSSPVPTDGDRDGQVPSRPVVHDGLDEEDEQDRNMWAEWVKGKLAAIKGWANGLIDKVKGKDGKEDDGKGESGKEKDGG